jgi:MFS family permease
MGTSRAIFGKFGDRLDIEKFMLGSVGLCVIAFLMISLSPWPVVSLIGCALCGFSVGIMWPGTLSKAAVALPAGGTAMFALLALAGDIGCSAGPSVVGFVSDLSNGAMQKGILATVIFPAWMLASLLLTRKKNK